MLEIRPYLEQDDFDKVLLLYSSVNWVAYTSDADRLRRALAKSHTVLVAVEFGEIIGLIRSISDGEVICYVQDILVKPRNQRRGVGRALMTTLLERSNLRQTVLLTDNEPTQRLFYQSQGFSLVEGSLNAFVQIR